MSDSGNPEVRDAGFDDFLDAIAAGEGYYLECSDGHGSLPPRRACPRCGDTELAERPLDDRGEVVTFTLVHVATPQFDDDVPYVTAIADFGPVRLTGIVRGTEPEAVELGQAVEPAVEESATTGERLLVLRPAAPSP